MDLGVVPQQAPRGGLPAALGAAHQLVVADRVGEAQDVGHRRSSSSSCGSRGSAPPMPWLPGAPAVGSARCSMGEVS
ncbi:Uncharacterised protein [Mycobacteroides abscessus]|nr:Uncharacterised protein [Mycobacteroides abscessus]